MMKWTTLYGKNINPTLRGGGKMTMSKKHNWDLIKQINPSTESGDKQPFRQNRVYDDSGIIPALPAQMSTGTHAVAIRRRPDNETGKTKDNLEISDSDNSNCLHSNAYKSLVSDKINIRRLTETECERLQGFKDGWTEFGNYDGAVKKISRTQRYKLIGNAVTKTMPEIIGKKLLNLTNA